MRAHWAGLGESTFVSGIWVLYGVHRWLGRWPFRLLLVPVVSLYWLFSRTARRASLQYLQRLHAHAATFSRPPGNLQSLRHFLQFGETLLDKLLASSGRYSPALLQFVGQQPLLARRASGKGGVIMTAHVGCLELLQAAAGWQSGLRLTVLVHTAHAEKFNRILTRLNPTSAVQLLQVTAFSPAMAMQLSERVAAGEFIAIAGDRVPVSGDRHVQATFLGHAAAWPSGPYLLAALLDCPLFMLVSLHHGKGYRVHIEQLAEHISLPRAQRQQALNQFAQSFADWLQTHLHASPYDWFNFYPFWIENSHASRN